MRFLVINVGEPIPTDRGKPRWFRAGLFARELVRMGHEVTWWTSAFDHFNREFRLDGELDRCEFEGIRYRLAPTIPYTKNVSIDRFRNHAILGREIRTELAKDPGFEAVYSSFPTIEAAFEACRYGARNGVSAVVDVRDAWPEVIVEQLPGVVRPFARVGLAPYYWKASTALRRATAVSGTSEGMVEFGRELGKRSSDYERDRAFPMAYEKPLIEPSAFDRARAYWDQQGVLSEDARNTLCFFGTFVQQKAVDFETPIRGMIKLRKQNPDLKLVMCGQGPRLEECRQLAAGDDGVLFPGQVDQPKIFALMERSFAGLLPYRPESHFEYSIPNKSVEYLAGGLPIVSSLTRGTLFGKLRSENVLCAYESGQLDDFARAVEETHADSETRKEASRRKYSEDFDSARIVSSMANWFLSVAEARGKK